MKLNDNLLEVIGYTINTNPTYTINVTLYLQGTVLCGTVISYPEYLKLTASLVENFGSPELGNTLNQLAKEYANDIKTAGDDFSISDIYLKDVIVLSEDNLKVPVWSGKLNQISGYNLGGIKIGN